MTKIALFPIPNAVAFPGTIFPLHVFEPRYRQMVKYCLEDNIPLAICHTEKELSPAKGPQSIKDALQSNQASYKPVEIFSAGACELVKTLDDGRLILDIHLKSRYRSLNELQRLPFLIHQCEIYPDSLLLESDYNEARLLQEKIVNRLTVMMTQLPEARERLESLNLLEKSPVDFSFQVFGLLQFDGEVQQTILEMTSSVDRLKWLLSHINR